MKPQPSEPSEADQEHEILLKQFRAYLHLVITAKQTGQDKELEALPGPNMMAYCMELAKVVPDTIRSLKGCPEKIASLTAYDYPTTKLLDEAGVPLILVGDSLGMVVLGYEDTTHVTMAEMEHHVRAAARARPPGWKRSRWPTGSN